MGFHTVWTVTFSGFVNTNVRTSLGFLSKKCLTLFRYASIVPPSNRLYNVLQLNISHMIEFLGGHTQPVGWTSEWEGGREMVRNGG